MIGAILRAQWISLRNMRGKGRSGAWFTILTSGLWYGFWAVLAGAAFVYTVDPDNRRAVALTFPTGLLLMMLYWQVTPLMVASLGAALDLKKLLIYPIPPERLFWVEVTLRLTTGVEMLMVLTGSALGLMCNPVSGGWSRVPLVLPPLLAFVFFNLLLAAGMRNLMERLMSHKRLREIIVLVMVIAAALPQLLLLSGLPWERLQRYFSENSSPLWPWTAASRIALDGHAWLPWVVLWWWIGAAYTFGRKQFTRSLRFDAQAARATRADPDQSSPRNRVTDVLFRFPAMFLPDPVGAMVEKELRTLARAQRFRLVFIMGFTFGLLVWLPLMFGSGRQSRSPLFEHFLTLICVYALTLLGQVSYWNAFGFDRSAVQVYFSLPVPFSRTLVAKNVAAAILIVLEMSAVTLACMLLRMRPAPDKVLEAFLVTPIVGLYLIAAGNLSSVHLPRAMNPERASHSGSSGKSQALVLFVYPFAMTPVLLAYFGRFAFKSDAVFFALLGFAALVGGIIYWLSLESAVKAAVRRREDLIAELSRADGPVASD